MAKIFAPLPLIKTYCMSPLSATFISMDITVPFKALILHSLWFGSVLMSPIQMGSLSVNNSVTNISRLGTFNNIYRCMVDYCCFVALFLNLLYYCATISPYCYITVLPYAGIASLCLGTDKKKYNKKFLIYKELQI